MNNINLFQRIALINVMTMAQVILVTGFVLEHSVTVAALNRGRGAMLILLVPVDSVFVDELETDVTLHFVGV